MQQTVVLAIKEYLAARETEEILADPEALPDIAAVREGATAAIVGGCAPVGGT